MVIQLWTPTAADFEVLGKLVRWCCSVHTAHRPAVGSGLCPGGTTRAELTTAAAMLPTLQPLPSIEPGRTRMGDAPPVSFWVVSNEPND